MNCENINIKELLEKAQKYDKLKEDYDQGMKDIENQIILIREFFESLSIDFGTWNAIKKCSNGFGIHYSFASKLIYHIKLLLDKDYQGRELSKERKRYRDEYKAAEHQLFSQMEYKENELTEAWEKFRAIKTKKYQKILEEINNEENI